PHRSPPHFLLSLYTLRAVPPFGSPRWLLEVHNATCLSFARSVALLGVRSALHHSARCAAAASRAAAGCAATGWSHHSSRSRRAEQPEREVDGTHSAGRLHPGGRHRSGAGAVTALRLRFAHQR